MYVFGARSDDVGANDGLVLAVQVRFEVIELCHKAMLDPIHQVLAQEYHSRHGQHLRHPLRGDLPTVFVVSLKSRMNVLEEANKPPNSDHSCCEESS
jgi:hypothetical protein